MDTVAFYLNTVAKAVYSKALQSQGEWCSDVLD